MSIPSVGIPSVGIPLLGVPSGGCLLVGMPLVVGILYAGIPFVDILVNYIDSNEPTQRLPNSARLQSDLEKHHLHHNSPLP